MGGNMVERLMRQRPQARRLRSQRRHRREVQGARRDAGGRSRGGRRRAADTARHLDHGARRRSGRPDDRRRSGRCSRAGDIIIDGGNSNFHDTIRRGARAREVEDRVHRLGHERRHLGTRERLLPDGRRQRHGGEALRADLHRARAGERLRARRSDRRRPLREDGAQRHRVRSAPGVRRGIRDPARVEDLSRSSTSSRSPKSGSTGASCGRGSTSSRRRAFSARRVARRHQRAGSPTPAKDAGPCRRRSTSTSRRR